MYAKSLQDFQKLSCEVKRCTEQTAVLTAGLQNTTVTSKSQVLGKNQSHNFKIFFKYQEEIKH